MEISKIIRRVIAMRRKAKDQPGTPEGDNALAHAQTLEESHGISIPDDALDHVTKNFDVPILWQQMMVEVLADLLELGEHSKDGVTTVTGSKVYVDELTYLYDYHAEVVKRITLFSAMGYMLGAIPEMRRIMLEMFERQKTKNEVVPKELEQVRKMMSDPSAKELSMLTFAEPVGKENKRPLWESLKKKDVD